MFNILKLNEISNKIDKIFDSDYNVTKDTENPDGILLRSFSMHEYPVKDKLLAVARCGAGVNNIPIPDYSEKAIVVFNTPGANANAVKELVLCSLILSSRNIVSAVEWVNTLKGTPDIPKQVESGKKAFIGPEIKGKTLGIIGLGAIGSLIANSAVALDMNVLGYDPFLSVDVAWKLSSEVQNAKSMQKILTESDYITLHVPYNKDTKGIINKEAVSKMKNGVTIINCARGELVDNDAVIEGLKSGKIAKYVTDFPCEELVGVKNVITIPHLGASTPEAEDNCAVMAAKQLKDFLENGNIVNSVNFPTTVSPRAGVQRMTVVHKNVPGIIAKATTILSNHKINIANILCTSRGELAYMIIDVDSKMPKDIEKEFYCQEGIMKIRIL